jgi:hypothetical protein
MLIPAPTFVCLDQRGTRFLFAVFSRPTAFAFSRVGMEATSKIVIYGGVALMEPPRPSSSASSTSYHDSNMCERLPWLVYILLSTQTNSSYLSNEQAVALGFPHGDPQYGGRHYVHTTVHGSRGRAFAVNYADPINDCQQVPAQVPCFGHGHAQGHCVLFGTASPSSICLLLDICPHLL